MAGGRPLYQSAGSARRAGDGHAGLWYDKFCDQWRDDQGGWSMSAQAGAGPKAGWIGQVTGLVGADGDRLPEFARRMVRLVTARAGWVEVFISQERFVTGLGRSHPVENGFAWHPTLGTPYLPGSSLKGLTRAWAVEEGCKGDADRLLGSRTSVGEVGFLDAVPPVPVRLEADVMTPHYAGWDIDHPPGDWCSPNPIPFLVAAAGTSLLVGVLPRCPRLPDEDRELVRGWLRAALGTAGAGAKTAVGYGRFQPDPDLTAQQVRAVTDADRAARQRREREQAMATPEGRWRLRLSGAAEADVLEFVRVHLEAEPLTDPAERAAFVRAVRETGHPARWRRGEKADRATQTGAKRLKELARLLVAEQDGDGS
jgi:CRISPR-associated protein Cmr6